MTNVLFTRMLCVIMSCLLLSCSLPPSQGSPTNSQGATPYSPNATPSPIPNLMAEAVMDANFDLFLSYLAQTDWTRSPEEFLSELREDTFVLDLRQPLEVSRQGFIPGAVLIPIREVAQKTSALPDYFDPVYAYSLDTWRCGLLVASLGVFGWDIRCLEGGFEAWMASGGAVEQGELPYPKIDPLKPAFPCCGTFEPDALLDPLATPDPNAPHPALVAASQKIFNTLPDHYGAVRVEELKDWLRSNPDLLLIDLRSEASRQNDGDMEAGNVLHIPMVDLIAQRSTWPADRSTPVVLVSDNGDDASVCLSILWAYGYQEVRALVGGFQAWSMGDSSTSGSIVELSP